MTPVAFSYVRVFTGGELPGVRGFRRHLLHTITFLVYSCLKYRNIIIAISLFHDGPGYISFNDLGLFI